MEMRASSGLEAVADASMAKDGITDTLSSCWLVRHGERIDETDQVRS
jgi:hypothetical protein